MKSHSHSFNNQGYLPNGASGASSGGGAANLLPNNGRVVQAGGARVLCVADVRGTLFGRDKDAGVLANDTA